VGEAAREGIRRQEVAVTEEEVFDAIVAAKPGPEEVLFVGRNDKDYSWRSVPAGEPMSAEVDGVFLEAWMFITIPWPTEATEEAQRAFFDDLIAEMETMADGPDRCRWEFDDPYGYRH
jgi:hypothetical protein